MGYGYRCNSAFALHLSYSIPLELRSGRMVGSILMVYGKLFQTVVSICTEYSVTQQRMRVTISCIFTHRTALTKYFWFVKKCSIKRDPLADSPAPSVVQDHPQRRRSGNVSTLSNIRFAFDTAHCESDLFASSPTSWMEWQCMSATNRCSIQSHTSQRDWLIVEKQVSFYWYLFQTA